VIALGALGPFTRAARMAVSVPGAVIHCSSGKLLLALLSY